MPKTAIISTLCTDRVGLIAAISGRLFDMGANLGSTTFAVLGGAAEFTTISEFPDDIDLAAIEAGLTSLAELDGAEKISVAWFDLPTAQGPTSTITHRITLSGGDCPGLVARLCEVFIQFDANIVRLNAEQVEGQNDTIYLVRIAVWIPQGKETSCLNTVSNTAGELGLDCVVETV